MEYTGKGQGNLNTVLGAIGTAGVTGILGGNGLNLFGNSSGADGYVSRYELGLIQENAILKAQSDVDRKLVDVYSSMNDKVNAVRDSFSSFEKEQLVYNGVNTATMQCMQNNIAALLGMTKTVIPNSSVCPGWGTATVSVSTGTTTA